MNIFGVHAARSIAIQSKMRDLLLVGRCEQKDDARSPLNILLLAAHSVNWFGVAVGGMEYAGANLLR